MQEKTADVVCETGDLLRLYLRATLKNKRKGVDSLSTIIAVCSGKGGAGKTTVTAALAHFFSRYRKTLVLDFNFGLRNMDHVLGVEDRVVFTYSDIFSNNVPFDKAVVKVKDRLDFLCSSPYMEEPPDIGKVLTLIEEGVRRADIILLDTPSSLEEGFRLSVSVADSLVVVTTPSEVTVRGGDKAALAAMVPRSRTGLVINRCDDRGMTEEAITERLPFRVLARIPVQSEVDPVRLSHLFTPVPEREAETGEPKNP